jgi:hypothetical protein
MLALGLVLGATLFASETRSTPGAICLVCGERGLADAILNVVLFVPLGLALALYRWRLGLAFLSAVLLSVVVEFAQFFIPGRDANLGDLFFNAIGAGLGLLGGRSRARLLWPSRSSACLLSLSALLVAMGIFGLTAYLLAPSFPPSEYYGQWTPKLGHLQRYRGQVIRATVGPVPIRPGKLDSDTIRSLLLKGAPLRVAATAGPRVGGLASLVSIYDGLTQEIVLLGPDRDDLAFRFRTRANSVRLDRPDIRLVGALSAASPGDSLSIFVESHTDGYCVSLNRRRECGLGFTLGMGWSLLLYRGVWPQWMKLALNYVWIAIIAMPVALWARRWWFAVSVSVAVLSAMGLLPTLSVLRPTPVPEFVAAVAGLLSGLWLQRQLHSATPNSTRAVSTVGIVQQ